MSDLPMTELVARGVFVGIVRAVLFLAACYGLVHLYRRSR